VVGLAERVRRSVPVCQRDEFEQGGLRQRGHHVAQLRLELVREHGGHADPHPRAVADDQHGRGQARHVAGGVVGGRHQLPLGRRGGEGAGVPQQLLGALLGRRSAEPGDPVAEAGGHLVDEFRGGLDIGPGLPFDVQHADRPAVGVQQRRANLQRRAGCADRDVVGVVADSGDGLRLAGAEGTAGHTAPRLHCGENLPGTGSGDTPQMTSYG
jgi:hypothetical protein